MHGFLRALLGPVVDRADSLDASLAFAITYAHSPTLRFMSLIKICLCTWVFRFMTFSRLREHTELTRHPRKLLSAKEEHDVTAVDDIQRPGSG